MASKIADGVDTLLEAARSLDIVENNPHRGTWMLLLAAAALCADREAFVKMAGEAFSVSNGEEVS